MNTEVRSAVRSSPLRELIAGLPVRLARGSADSVVHDIAEDSRHATKGCLFIARPGTKSDGRAYIAEAVGAGAIAVLTDNVTHVPTDVACLECEDIATAAAVLAERFYGQPSKMLRLIGITGTNGKTTTAYLIRHLLNSAGIHCGLIGTVQIDDGVQTYAANLTTPPSIELSRLMRTMADHGCQACVMEASSHALHQKRTAGLHFHVGVFTNLTGDHLDYHQTMDAYLDSKAILFEGLAAGGFAIFNTDDPASESMIKRTAAPTITCSTSDRGATCLARIGDQSLTSIETVFSAPDMWGKIECHLPLIGRHNAINALQALAVGHVMGLDRDALKQGISTCKAPPGRLEPVTAAEASNDDFAVLVDYAHTDDALENVLRALRPILNGGGGKLRAVFGCGGDRDRTKRPRMAAVACKYADDVIITSDNPRTEDPQAIIEEIRAGVPHDRLGSTLCIVDRAQAIHAAIERAGEGDIVLIAGKGHEDYQIIGTTKRPFDDRQIAAAALVRRKSRVTVA